MNSKAPDDFEMLVTQEGSSNLLKEFTYFVRQNRKYWLIPLVLILAAFGFIMFLATTGAAPFTYTLF